MSMPGVYQRVSTIGALGCDPSRDEHGAKQTWSQRSMEQARSIEEHAASKQTTNQNYRHASKPLRSEDLVLKMLMPVCDTL